MPDLTSDPTRHDRPAERTGQPWMGRLAALSCLVLLACALLAVPAADAATYIVTLDNGNTFESRFQPSEASWDPDMVMLMTEHGNWIGLEKANIREVTTDIESAGFGTVIDSKTISLGVLANDRPEPTEGEPSNRELIQEFLANQPPPQDYSVEQFVDPSQAGGGLPVGYSQAPQAPLVLNSGGN